MKTIKKIIKAAESFYGSSHLLKEVTLEEGVREFLNELDEKKENETGIEFLKKLLKKEEKIIYWEFVGTWLWDIEWDFDEEEITFIKSIIKAVKNGDSAVLCRVLDGYAHGFCEEWFMEELASIKSGEDYYDTLCRLGVLYNADDISETIVNQVIEEYIGNCKNSVWDSVGSSLCDIINSDETSIEDKIRFFYFTNWVPDVYAHCWMDERFSPETDLELYKTYCKDLIERGNNVVIDCCLSLEDFWTVDELVEFAAHPSARVRWNVALDSELPVEVLNKLSEDENEYVAKMAAETLEEKLEQE